MLETCFPYALMHAAHVDMSLGKMRGSDGSKKGKKGNDTVVMFAKSDGNAGEEDRHRGNSSAERAASTDVSADPS